VEQTYLEKLIFAQLVKKFPAQELLCLPCAIHTPPISSSLISAILTTLGAWWATT